MSFVGVLLGCFECGGCNDPAYDRRDAPGEVAFEVLENPLATETQPGQRSRRSEAYTADDLLEAAESGNFELVQDIIHSGDVDLNSTDPVDNYCALMNAAEAGHGAIAEALCVAGASTELRDSYGRSPLYAAAVAGHCAAVESLLRFGADAEARDSEDRSPLWACCAVRKLEVAQILIDSGSDIDAKTFAGDSAVEFAVLHGHAEVTAFLRAHNAHETTSRLSLNSR